MAQAFLLSSGSPGKPNPNLPPTSHTKNLKMSTAQVKLDCHALESPLLSVLRSLLRRFYPSVKLKALLITNSCPEGMPTSLEALLVWWACPTQSPSRLPPSLGFQPRTPGDAKAWNSSTATVASTVQHIIKQREPSPLWLNKKTSGTIKCKQGRERGGLKQSLRRKTR